MTAWIPWDRSRGIRFWQVMVLLVPVVGAYSNTFSGEFHFDDFSSIVYNSSVQGSLSVRRLLAGGTRPVSALVSSLDFRLFGLNPFGYHVTNLLIHLTACSLVWRLLFLATEPAPSVSGPLDRVRAGWLLFPAVWFGVHPINTMAVTYVVQGRMAALVAALAVGSVCAFAQGCRGRPRVWFPVAVALFVLGLGTKENAGVIPFAALAYDLFVLSGGQVRKLGARWKFHLTQLATLAAAVLVFVTKVDPEFLGLFSGRLALLDSAQTTSALTPWRYLLTQFGVVLHYLRLVVVPTGQSVDYFWPVVPDFASPRAWAPLLGLSMLLGTAAWLLRSSRAGLFGLTWLVLFLLPESSFVPLEDVIFEHRFYLPFVGLLVALAGAAAEVRRREFAARLWGERRWRRAVAVLLTVLTAAYGSLAYARNSVWTTRLSLYEDAYRKQPAHPGVRANLLTALVEHGRYEEALRLYQTLPESYRGQASVQLSVVAALLCLGRDAEADAVIRVIQQEGDARVLERLREVHEMVRAARGRTGHLGAEEGRR
ncbi:MAG: tetratricopeptide repeat protein [Deltaproteobacteria bacterium]|nr:tetratricopeptide repeat protein [Deltaproteobacteria bacterium]